MEHLNASAESAGNNEDNGGEEEKEAESEDGSSPPPRADHRNHFDRQQQIRLIIATHSPPTSTPSLTPPPTTTSPYQSYPCPPSRPHRGEMTNQSMEENANKKNKTNQYLVPHSFLCIVTTDFFVFLVIKLNTWVHCAFGNV